MNERIRSGVLAMSRFMPLWARIIGPVVAAIGLLFLVFGLGGWSQSRPYSDGEVVAGTVVESLNEPSTSDDGRDRYFDVVSYAVDGVDYEVTSTNYHAEPQTTGRSVDVSYRLADPAEARIVDAGGFWLVFATIGGLLTLAGLAVLFGMPRYVRRVQAELRDPAS